MTVGIELKRKPDTSSNMKLARLGDHVEILSGFAFDSSRFATDGQMPLIRIRDVVRGKTETYYSGPFNEKFVVRKGDLLVGMDGDFNRETWSSEPALLNQRVCRISPLDANLDHRYLYHFLPQALMEIWHATPFATVKHLSVKTIREIALPLPPLDEQRRIAAILDKADELRTKRRQALAQLDTLTLSLFQDIFGHSSANDEKWPVIALESVASQITDGEHQTPIRQSSGIKLLSARNVRNGRLDVGNVDYIDMSEYERISRRCRPQRDDVLISCSGSIGRVAVVDTDENFSLVRSVALVRPRPEMLLSKFLEQQLLTPKLQRKMNQSANTSSQANLFQGPIRKLPIVLPPIELQRDFVDKAVAVERLKDQHRAQIVALHDLFASLQHRAFRGEL